MLHNKLLRVIQAHLVGFSTNIVLSCKRFCLFCLFRTSLSFAGCLVQLVSTYFPNRVIYRAHRRFIGPLAGSSDILITKLKRVIDLSALAGRIGASGRPPSLIIIRRIYEGVYIVEALLEKWARCVTRWPLLIIAVWIIIVPIALKFGPSIDAVAAKQNNTSSLPTSALSVQADHLYTTKFAAGQQSVNKETDLLVLTDPQGISSQDVALAEQIAAWLNAPETRPAHLLTVAG